MGGIQFSPVVEAFLRGQQQQGELTSQAQSIADRRKQIDAAIKEAEDKHKLDQEHLALDHQIFELNFKKAQQEAHQNVIEQLKANPETAPGTTNFQQPDVRMAIPGMSQDQMIPRSSMGLPSSSIVTPQPGSPVTINTPFGLDTVNMPKSNQEMAIEQANALIPAEIKKYQSTVGNTNTQKLENALQLKNIQSDYMEKLQELRNEASYYAADSRSAVARENEMRQLEMTMFTLFGPEGVQAVISKDPQMFGGIVGRHAARIGQGLEEESDLPTGLKGAVGTYMGRAGITKPEKGIRTDLSAITGGAQQLYNDFKVLDNKYPAGSQLMDRVGNMIAGAGRLNPIKNFTNIGQDFDMYGSNIANYAGLTGETPGMMRSPLLATKAAAAAPAPGDTPTVREEKRKRIVDLAFSKLQRKIGSLSTPQRIEFWKDAINQMQDLRTDASFADTFSKILKTGTYDSSYLNIKDNASK